jgi:hypothetical protein
VHRRLSFSNNTSTLGNSPTSSAGNASIAFSLRYNLHRRHDVRAPTHSPPQPHSPCDPRSLFLRQLAGRNQPLLCAAFTTARDELGTVLAVSHEPAKHQRTPLPVSFSDIYETSSPSNHSAQLIRGSICRADIHFGVRRGCHSGSVWGIGTPSRQ